MGTLTGIDMSDENYGLMPNSDWKRKNRGERWQKGETLNTVIGQVLHYLHHSKLPL